MPDRVIPNLIGGGSSSFRRGASWPDAPALFHAKREWFADIASLSIFKDPEEWLNRAPELTSFITGGVLARSEARRRYLQGESIT